MSTEQKEIRVIEHYLGMPKGSVKLSNEFTDDLGCDSLDSIEMLMVMEEEFDIEIDIEGVPQIPELPVVRLVPDLDPKDRPGV